MEDGAVVGFLDGALVGDWDGAVVGSAVGIVGADDGDDVGSFVAHSPSHDILITSDTDTQKQSASNDPFIILNDELFASKSISQLESILFMLLSPSKQLMVIPLHGNKLSAYSFNMEAVNDASVFPVL